MIHQNASVFASLLGVGESVAHTLTAGRKTWIQVARGQINVNGIKAGTGDGLAIESETSITISAPNIPSEFLLFDLP